MDFYDGHYGVQIHCQELSLGAKLRTGLWSLPMHSPLRFELGMRTEEIRRVAFHPPAERLNDYLLFFPAALVGAFFLGKG